MSVARNRVAQPERSYVNVFEAGRACGQDNRNAEETTATTAACSLEHHRADYIRPIAACSFFAWGELLLRRGEAVRSVVGVGLTRQRKQRNGRVNRGIAPRCVEFLATSYRIHRAPPGLKPRPTPASLCRRPHA